MANSVDLIIKYLPEALDTVYKRESYLSYFAPNTNTSGINFIGAGKVRIPKLYVDGLSNYSRANRGDLDNNKAHYRNGSADGYEVGSANVSWQERVLTHDRGRQFQIDAMDLDETGRLLGLTLNEFIRTRVIPEQDAVCFATIANSCNTSLGNKVSETIAADTIMSKLYEAFQWLENQEVPDTDQIIFVSTNVMKLIRTTDELFRRLDQVDYHKGDVSFTIRTFEGRPLIVVPDSRFYDEVEVSDNGYKPTTNSKLINFIVASKNAVLPIIKLETAKFYDRSVVQDFDGYKFNFRVYYDVIIPDNKVVACYTSLSQTDANTATNTLALAQSAGSATNTYVVNHYWTTPSGLWGTLVSSATAFTVGNTITIDGTTIKEIALGTEITETATTQYFALVDSKLKVVATTPSAITLVKGA